MERYSSSSSASSLSRTAWISAGFQLLRRLIIGCALGFRQSIRVGDPLAVKGLALVDQEVPGDAKQNHARTLFVITMAAPGRTFRVMIEIIYENFLEQILRGRGFADGPQDIIINIISIGVIESLEAFMYQLIGHNRGAVGLQ